MCSLDWFPLGYTKKKNIFLWKSGTWEKQPLPGGGGEYFMCGNEGHQSVFPHPVAHRRLVLIQRMGDGNLVFVDMLDFSNILVVYHFMLFDKEDEALLNSLMILWWRIDMSKDNITSTEQILFRVCLFTLKIHRN